MGSAQILIDALGADCRRQVLVAVGDLADDLVEDPAAIALQLRQGLSGRRRRLGGKWGSLRRRRRRCRSWLEAARHLADDVTAENILRHGARRRFEAGARSVRRGRRGRRALRQIKRDWRKRFCRLA